MESREQQPPPNETETSIDLDDKEKYSEEAFYNFLQIKIDTSEYGMSQERIQRNFHEGSSVTVFLTNNFDLWLSTDYHAAVAANNGLDSNDLVFVGRIYNDNSKIGWFNPDFYVSSTEKSGFTNFYKELGNDKTLEMITNKVIEFLK